MINLTKYCIVVCLTFSMGYAQSGKRSKDQSKPSSASGSSSELNLKVYRNALKCADYYTAIIALNYVVAEQESGLYRDSLAYMYHIAGNYYQALYWSEEVLKTDAINIGMLEVKANCLKQTNQYVKAIEVFEKLIEVTRSPIHAFNLVELQYQIKRLYECVASTELAEKLAFTDEMKYSYKVDETHSKNAKLISAFYNFRGLALFELGSKELAEQAFVQSLNADTSFLLAKMNLTAVRSELAVMKEQEKSEAERSKKEKSSEALKKEE